MMITLSLTHESDFCKANVQRHCNSADAYFVSIQNDAVTYVGPCTATSMTRI